MNEKPLFKQQSLITTIRCFQEDTVERDTEKDAEKSNTTQGRNSI